MAKGDVKELSQWFVKEIIGRPWTQADWSGARVRCVREPSLPEQVIPSVCLGEEMRETQRFLLRNSLERKC